MKKLLCCLILAAVLMTGSAQAETSLRLHVIGKTDLDEDQTFKLQVRDIALEYISENGAEDTDALEKHLNSFAKATHKSDLIRVERGIFPYPPSESAGRQYPAGDYDALRIYIGGAEGRNWWSMLYPEQSGLNDENIIYYSAIVDWFLSIFGVC